MWQVSFKLTFNAIKKKKTVSMRKAISRRCEALIKLMAGHQDAGGGISRASASLVRHLGRGGSSTVEPSRWWTYAALMHAIITFISWRWHVTSSGLQAVTEAGSIAFFFFYPHSSTPNYLHSQLQAKKHKSVVFFVLWNFTTTEWKRSASTVEHWRDWKGCREPARPVVGDVGWVSGTPQFSNL